MSVGSGSPIIQRNLISDGMVGINMMYLSSCSKPIIQNNTISNCFRGISIGDSPTIIFAYNNLEAISNFTVYSWRTAQNLNATYSWWGTTNAGTIDQEILDYNDDFNSGKVNYTPFLIEPNPNVPPIPQLSDGAPDGASNTPTVPEFTVAIVASSLEVTIKNQPITAFVDTNSSNPSLYYGFRFKDNENIHDWNYDPQYYVLPSSYGMYCKASNSDYAVVSFKLESYSLTGILVSGKVDVQVMALIGNEFPTNYENGAVYRFDGLTSVWSSTQKITIDGNDSMTAEPFPTLLDVAVAVTVVTVIAVAAMVYHKKRKS